MPQDTVPLGDSPDVLIPPYQTRSLEVTMNREHATRGRNHSTTDILMTDEQQLPEEPIGSELLRDDPSFADIVLQFVDGLGDRLAKMEEAIAAADFEALRRVAHQLKGSGGGYGYPALSEQAADLEKRARARVLDECAEALDDLRKLCDRLVVDPQ